MHVVLSRVTHKIRTLGTTDEMPMQLIAKIPCSNMVFATDAMYKKLFVMDMPPAVEQTLNEIQGYELSDLVVCSVPLFDPLVDTGHQTVGGLACDETAHTVYALILDPPAAYIRMYRFVNRTLEQIPMTYKVPWDDGITYGTIEPDVAYDPSTHQYRQNLLSLAHEYRVGKVDFASPTTLGSGLVYRNNRLYIMTRRKFKAEVHYDFHADVLLSAWGAHRTNPNNEFEPTGWMEERQIGSKIDMYRVIWMSNMAIANGFNLQPLSPSEFPLQLLPEIAPVLSMYVEGGTEDDTITITIGQYQLITLDVIAGSAKDSIVIPFDVVSTGGSSEIKVLHENDSGNGARLFDLAFFAVTREWYRFLTAHFRHSEVRSMEYWKTLIHTIDPMDGTVINYNWLSEPFANKDAFFNALTEYDEEMLLGKRHDSHLLPINTLDWHLEKYTYHIHPKSNSNANSAYYDVGLLEPVGELNWVDAAVEDLIPPPALMDKHPNQDRAIFETALLTVQALHPEIFKPGGRNPAILKKKIQEIIYLYKTATARTQYPTARNEFRGPSEMATMPLIADSTNGTFLPTVQKYMEIPFDVVLPNAMSSDDTERKIFCVFGDKIWTFDALDYTLIVQYPGALFYGDIIDFGDILETRPVEYPCFIRNDSVSTLENVQISIILDADSPRSEDMFLKTPGDTAGYKTIHLGSIVPGGSAEFSVRAYNLDVAEWETHQTYRVPLRVHYNRNHLW